MINDTNIQYIIEFVYIEWYNHDAIMTHNPVWLIICIHSTKDIWLGYYTGLIMIYYWAIILGYTAIHSIIPSLGSVGIWTT